MEAPISLKQILLEEAEKTYIITEKLFRKLDDRELHWKPSHGKNWMKVSQLLMHCANYGCGKAVQGFVRGDWNPVVDPGSDHSSEVQHVPPAEILPDVESVDQALKLLAEDHLLTINCINETRETELLIRRSTAPWGGPDQVLFQHLLMMIMHLNQHKGQLFYYLKLMGRDVNTNDLWGE